MKNVCILVTVFKKQLGFRNNHSTTDELISLTDLITKYLDNNCFVCGVFIDVQKALDSDKYEILHVKLDFYGICELVRSWLKSFPENRNQYVDLPGHTLSVKAVTCGVPTLRFSIRSFAFSSLYK